MNPSLKLYGLALCCLALALSNLAAGNQSEPRNGLQKGHQTRLLQHLLEMDDQELSGLRQTIERIEKMEPEEKEQLRKKIGRMHKMDPQQVDKMREKYQSIPEATRREMRKRWTEMSPKERAEWRKKLSAMSPEDRTQLFEQEGFLPIHRKPNMQNGGNRTNQGLNKKRAEKGPPPPPTE